MSPINATCLLVISDGGILPSEPLNCQHHFPLLARAPMQQANPCWQGALDAFLERGRLCVREHLIEKEVCYVQIPETVYALVAQPVQPKCFQLIYAALASVCVPTS